MHLPRSFAVFAVLILALSWGGCDGGGNGSGPDADTTPGVDTETQEDTATDVPVGPDLPVGEDVPPESVTPADTLGPPTCEGPGIMGQVVQEDGNPIGGAKLFLCGTVNGSETCNPRTADGQGWFTFQTLEPGYTHLEVNATLAGVGLGLAFAGYSLVVDPTGPDCLDMGQIVLPELPAGEIVVAAEGGVVTIGPLILEFPAGCPVFPDYSEQGEVGGALVDVAGAYWAPDGAVLAAAFHPFKGHCDPGTTVRVDGSAGLTAPTLLYNDLVHGGAEEVGAMTPDGDGWVLEAALPDLTWIWITD